MNTQSLDTPENSSLNFTKKGLALLIIPLMIEQTLTSLMGVADTLMVSSAGEAAISGVTCMDTINVLIMYIFEALGMGGSVLTAQYIGRGDKSSVRSIVRQLMTLELISSALITLLCFCFTGSLINLLYPSLEPAVYSAAFAYFRITALSNPFLALYSASAALYRASGNAKLPVTVITAGNILNIAGNALLIFVFHMGAVGAALATLFSRIFSCLVLLWLQYRESSGISLRQIISVPFSLTQTGKILSIGTPTALENGMFQFGKIIIQAIVVTLGTTAIAAQAITVQVETLGSRPAIAVGVALVTVAGQCMGAGRPDLARKYTDDFLRVTYIICIITAPIFIYLVRPICALTALSAEAAHLVFLLMAFICIAKIFLWPRAFLLQNCLKAAGDVKYPMWVVIISMWIFRVCGALLLCGVFRLGLWGVWIAWITDWVVRVIFFSVRYHQGRWEKIRL